MTRDDKVVALHDYHASHVVWCTNRDSEFTMHSDDEPYCSHMVTSIGVIPEGDAVKCQAWVIATRAFTHGQFAPADYAKREQRYGGVEIALETWRGPNAGSVTEQKIRLSSDAVRSLAAALVRAADIEQGLNL
jgi:hypothetical protein